MFSCFSSLTCPCLPTGAAPEVCLPELAYHRWSSCNALTRLLSPAPPPAVLTRTHAQKHLDTPAPGQPWRPAVSPRR